VISGEWAVFKKFSTGHCPLSTVHCF